MNLIRQSFAMMVAIVLFVIALAVFRPLPERR
jgi:hypothetical protein